MKYNYSIVVPYRDKYDLFVKAVDSIPDRNDIQIVIVDNAIEALTKEKIPTKQQATVVYTTSSPTKGAGCARNEGLKHVEGKFLLFLDADDYFTPDAFDSFDKYLSSDYDIVFFKPTSIKLSDGTNSDRHYIYDGFIEEYIKTSNEDKLRHRWVTPWSKMIRASVVREHQIQFDETKVANDAMFSAKSGHYARTITACDDVVYVVTEGGVGSSLTKSHNKENMFIRYQVAVRRYQFVVSIGRKDQRPRLAGFIRAALFTFGLKEAYRYWRYARDNKCRII